MIKAKSFYTVACELGDMDSCNKLGYYNMDVVVELKSVKEMFVADNACKRGNFMSCYKLGLAYDTGNIPEVEQDRPKGMKYFKEACNAGHSLSCKHIGDIERYNPIKIEE
jgi:TPR repeat protein